MSASSTSWRPVLHPARIGLIVLIGAVITALALLDWSLEQAEQSEMQNVAWQRYSSGMELLKQGKTTAAVEDLRRAHALERSNQDYELGLIEALMGAGKIDEAQPLMEEVLQDSPNDGRANLIAARLMRKRGKIRDAKAYYHRAIYGEWPSDAREHRIETRLELIQLLETKGNEQELLAELLPLEEDADHNEQLQLQLAKLFLVAGAPLQSADLYRAVLEHDPKSAPAYAGLGEADLQQGEYRRARGNFLQAYYHNARDSHIESRLELAGMLASLDPTLRQLPSIEKYRRSGRILEIARTDLQRCLARHSSQNASDLESLAASANKLLTARTPTHVTNEMAENRLELAEKIWQARLKVCNETITPDQESLQLLMEKLTH